MTEKTNNNNNNNNGILNNDWGNERRNHTKIRIWFGNCMKPTEVLLHDTASMSSSFCSGVTDTQRFKGDTDTVLPEAWEGFAVPLFRCLYSPSDVDIFVETYFLDRKKTITATTQRSRLNRILEATHCALYLGIDNDSSVYFWHTWYKKIRSRRNMILRPTGCTIEKDEAHFRFPNPKIDATWHNLPLEHALRWLYALNLSPSSMVDNIDDYMEFDMLSEENTFEYLSDFIPRFQQRVQQLPKGLWEEANDEVQWWNSLPTKLKYPKS